MPLHADLYLDRVDLGRYAKGPSCSVCHVDSLDELIERLRAGRVCAGQCVHWPPWRVEAFRMAVNSGDPLPTIPSIDVPRPTVVGVIDLNGPGPESALLVTSNSQLTHEVLLAVLSTTTLPVWLLSVDTGGNTVDMSLVYKTLTPQAVADGLAAATEPNGPLPTGFSGRILLPGLAGPMAPALSDLLGREVEVGPICAAELPLFWGEAWGT